MTIKTQQEIKCNLCQASDTWVFQGSLLPCQLCEHFVLAFRVPKAELQNMVVFCLEEPPLPHFLDSYYSNSQKIKVDRKIWLAITLLLKLSCRFLSFQDLQVLLSIGLPGTRFSYYVCLTYVATAFCLCKISSREPVQKH